MIQNSYRTPVFEKIQIKFIYHTLILLFRLWASGKPVVLDIILKSKTVGYNALLSYKVSPAKGFMILSRALPYPKLKHFGLQAENLPATFTSQNKIPGTNSILFRV